MPSPTSRGDGCGVLQDRHRGGDPILHREQLGQADVARVRVAVEAQRPLGEHLGGRQVAGVLGLHRQQVEQADPLLSTPRRAATAQSSYSKSTNTGWSVSPSATGRQLPGELRIDPGGGQRVLGATPEVVQVARHARGQAQPVAAAHDDVADALAGGAATRCAAACGCARLSSSPHSASLAWSIVTEPPLATITPTRRCGLPAGIGVLAVLVRDRDRPAHHRQAHPVGLTAAGPVRGCHRDRRRRGPLAGAQQGEDGLVGATLAE